MKLQYIAHHTSNKTNLHTWMSGGGGGGENGQSISLPRDGVA